MVIFGSVATIFLKIMDQQVYLPSGKNEDGSLLLVETRFQHPLLMNLLMFLGEAILLFVLYFKMQADPIAAAAHAKNKASPWVFAAPALLDASGSFLNFTALAFI